MTQKEHTYSTVLRGWSALEREEVAAHESRRKEAHDFSRGYLTSENAARHKEEAAKMLQSARRMVVDAEEEEKNILKWVDSGEHPYPQRMPLRATLQKAVSSSDTIEKSEVERSPK